MTARRAPRLLRLVRREIMRRVAGVRGRGAARGGVGARGGSARAGRRSLGGVDGSRSPPAATTERAAGGRNADADTFAASCHFTGKKRARARGRGAHLILELLERLPHDAACFAPPRAWIPGAMTPSVATPTPSRSRLDARLVASPPADFGIPASRTTTPSETFADERRRPERARTEPGPSATEDRRGKRERAPRDHALAHAAPRPRRENLRFAPSLCDRMQSVRLAQSASRFR